MRRRLIAALAFAAAAAAPAGAPAGAEELGGGGMADQEIGARLGTQVGLGGASPGGARVGGSFLYRMSEHFWFDAEAAFSFGSGDAGCYLARDPGMPLTCDHGPLDGMAVQANPSVRLLLPGAGEKRRVLPYLRGGVGVHLVQFAGDDVTGLAVPLLVGAGARVQVGARVAVGGELLVFGGPGFFGAGLGAEPYASLSVHFGVELGL